LRLGKSSLVPRLLDNAITRAVSFKINKARSTRTRHVSNSHVPATNISVSSAFINHEKFMKAFLRLGSIQQIRESPSISRGTRQERAGTGRNGCRAKKNSSKAERKQTTRSKQASKQRLTEPQ
jgi:hypothetical protein